MRDYYIALLTYQTAISVNHPNADTYLNAINQAYRNLEPWERKLITMIAEGDQQS